VNVNNYASYLSVACGEAGLLIFNLADPAKPQLTGTTEGIQVMSILKGPGIADFVTDGTRVMYLDTSNPSKPVVREYDPYMMSPSWDYNKRINWLGTDNFFLYAACGGEGPGSKGEFIVFE
jgi:hypothetical protein